MCHPLCRERIRALRAERTRRALEEVDDMREALGFSRTGPRAGPTPPRLEVVEV